MGRYYCTTHAALFAPLGSSSLALASSPSLCLSLCLSSSSRSRTTSSFRALSLSRTAFWASRRISFCRWLNCCSSRFWYSRSDVEPLDLAGGFSFCCCLGLRSLAFLDCLPPVLGRLIIMF